MTFRHFADDARQRRICRLGLFGILTCAASLLPATGAVAATCSLAVGQRVTLQSDAVDPDVFLWDSRARLVAYAAGGWDSTREVLDHTVLANPGTTAMIVSCSPGAAHPKYAETAIDAVGVKIVRGSFRGHFGWVIATDVRAVAR